MESDAADVIRVMVVDDHFIVRHGLVDIIRNEPDMQIVAEAEDGDEALAMHRRHHPDVTLMDLRMPRMSGHEATAAILKESPGSRIIILSGYSGDKDVRRALEAGACFYLLKDTPRAALVDAIRAVHRGESRLAPPITQRPERRSLVPELSEREREVLKLMAQGKTNHEIAETLYVSDGAVKSHVARIFRRLDAGNRSEAVMRALQRGIIQRDSQSESERRSR